MKSHLAIGIAAALVAGTPSVAQQTPLSGMALQQIQARDFEAPVSVVFPAVMTVFQDSGFRILSADKATGLITAVGSSQGRWTFNLWWGLGRKKETPIVSAFIEERGDALTRTRLNFVISTGKTRNVFTDERPVTDSAAYREAFERIEKEIFVRQAMAAPLPPTRSAVSTSPPVVANAPQPVPTPSIATGPRQWRQASYSPNLSVAFVDAANIAREGAIARFWVSIYYRPDQGTDHFISLREADCETQRFRDLSTAYFMEKAAVGDFKGASEPIQAKPNTVNAEIILTACGTRAFGKIFDNPDEAARLYFEQKNW